MRLGCEMSTVEMEHRMSQTQANHCAALVYTVSPLSLCLVHTTYVAGVSDTIQ